MSLPVPDNGWQEKHKPNVERLEKRAAAAFQVTERFFKFIQWFLILIVLRFLANSIENIFAYIAFYFACLIYFVCLYCISEGFFERWFLRWFRSENYYSKFSPIFAGILSLLLSFISVFILISVDVAQVLYRR